MATNSENTSNPLNSTQISGFYYDWQLNNPLLTATLHTNMRLTGITTSPGETRPLSVGDNPYEMEGKFEWKLWKPKKGATDSSQDDLKNGEVYCLEPITHNYSLAEDENPSACYRAKPLITSILNEDFQFNIGNSWGDAGGATSLESAFNNLKTLAPYKKELGAGIKSLGGTIKDFFGKKDGTGAANWIGDKAEKIGEAMGKGADALNSALIQQGSRFSYYGGTQTSFGNLSMRFTLFADWIWDETRKVWVFKTVHEQLREIYPYAVGKYYPLKLGLDQNVLKNNTTGLSDDIDKAVGSFFGWQQPPAGFQADMRSLDTCQRGTLRLVLGGYYTAENLLIDGMNVNFSKTMTKIPPRSKAYVSGGGEPKYENNVFSKKTKRTYEFEKEGTGENEITPLYADVTISLRPASSYSDNTIINFSSNNGRGRVNRDLVKMRNSALQKEIQKKQEKATLEKKTSDILKEFRENDQKNFEIDEDYDIIDMTLEEEPSLNYMTGDQMIKNLNLDRFTKL